jgi:FtsP/CotA-like multicopper oxidase with cupredoxin domain
MGGTTSTMHWHGFHQRETPYMDGVPFVTQCPIDFATTFRYAFPASEGGTQWYHSHTGHHKVDGHYGGLVVRTPASEDPNSALYDEDLPDHMIIVSDWMHDNADMFMPGNPTRGIGISPNNILINGKGVYTNVRNFNESKVRFIRHCFLSFYLALNKYCLCGTSSSVPGAERS